LKIFEVNNRSQQSNIKNAFLTYLPVLWIPNYIFDLFTGSLGPQLHF